MDKQTIFNMVRTHLHKQGERCMSAGGNSCMYRSGSYACSVGVLMNHVDIYSEFWEGSSIDELVADRKGYLLMWKPT